MPKPDPEDPPSEPSDANARKTMTSFVSNAALTSYEFGPGSGTWRISLEPYRSLKAWTGHDMT
jgi:hypothetical protein